MKDYEDVVVSIKEKWRGMIAHRSPHKDCRLHYTHRRLRGSHEQPWLPLALSLYLPAGGLPGDAQYQQQDGGNIH
ncbi:hypothetical protein [Prevotella sp. S7-1-8]|uniref:hypothetical protein n=1 Tax=Prevotella sp. S7-1-8 TaxID=1284775 RepID=UPI001E644B21|nr:hypothetical protein [Prevotella sp. S7-1-8]